MEKCKSASLGPENLDTSHFSTRNTRRVRNSIALQRRCGHSFCFLKSIKSYSSKSLNISLQLDLGFQEQSNKIADFSVIIYHTLLANLLTFQIIHLIWDNLFCVQITSSSPQWLCNFIYYNQLRGNSAQRSMLTIFSSKCFCGNRITTAEKNPLILYMSFRVPDFERWYVNFSLFSPVCT